LYAEISGDEEAAIGHLRMAASEQYRGSGGFMNAVARVHWARVMSRADSREAAVEPEGASRRSE
jgi:hypothetical protein